MQRHRLRAPSPALVISLIALFVALGGTTYAATSLPRNSVGSTQLKKNAVTTRKIKNGAVTAAKINPAGLAVKNAQHAAQADHATNADSAQTAANATNATQAGNAATVDSVTVKGFNTTATANGSVTLFTLDGLTLTADCSTGHLYATTSVGGAYISAAWITATNTVQYLSDTNFSTTDTFTADATPGAETGSIEYGQDPSTMPGEPDARVTVNLQTDMDRECSVSGHAFASSR